MTLSIKKTLKSLTIFLILSLFSCATDGVNTKFDPQFEFLTNQAGEVKACISKEKTIELKSILVQCKYGQGL